MSFFIRKALRFGPVRLNLSKSGFGLSAGVTGARLGVTSKGRPYVYGGRHGLYFRESLTAPGGRAASPANTTGPVTLYEATGVTYDEGIAGALPEPGDVPLPAVPSARRFLVLAGFGVLVALVMGGAVGWLVGGGLATFGGWKGWERHRDGRELRARQAAFLEACDAVASGEGSGEIGPDRLNRLEAELGGPSAFTRAARVDAFRGLCTLLFADHVLTPEEEEILEEVREALGVHASEVEDELAFADQLEEMHRIREGDLPEVETSIALRRGESGHFEAEGRLLRERQLRRFQRDRVRYSVRGFVLDREGRLLITDRRVMLVDDGVYEIRLGEILDLEVDVDQNVIRITRDGRARPIFLSTPHALRAGAIVARLTEQ